MNYLETLKPKLFVLFFIFIMNMLSPVMAYDFSSNVFKFQQKLANKGDPLAQYKLGNMYENGHGVKPDLNEALKWYKKSAASNNKAATRRIEYIDILKNGYQKNRHSKWLKLIHQDAKNHDGEAQFLLGTMYKNGIAVNKNLQKAYSLLKSASSKDIAGADDEYTHVKELINAEKEKQYALKQQQLEKQKAEQEKQEKALQKAAQQKRQLEKQKKQLLIAQQQAARKQKALATQQAAAKPVKKTPEPAKEKHVLSWGEAVELQRKKDEDN